MGLSQYDFAILARLDYDIYMYIDNQLDISEIGIPTFSFVYIPACYIIRLELLTGISDNMI